VNIRESWKSLTLRGAITKTTQFTSRPRPVPAADNQTMLIIKNNNNNSRNGNTTYKRLKAFGGLIHTIIIIIFIAAFIVRLYRNV